MNYANEMKLQIRKLKALQRELKDVKQIMDLSIVITQLLYQLNDRQQ
jgi:hypothetical protein